ncbi:hypothetical protein RDABS01_015945 [Bienertia sinuspersici]
MMSNGVSSSVSSQSCCTSSYFLAQNRSITSNPNFPSISTTNLRLNHLPHLSLSSRSQSQSLSSIRCSSSPGSGENDTKTVLDAFFLGKALGEALTERIESTVGEFLSTIGRLQAEQQKQVQDFQEDVLERAKRAKEKAARETLEEQGRVIPNSSMRNVAESNVTDPNAMVSRVGPMNPASPTRVVNPDSPVNEDRNDSDSLSSINIDE